MSIKGVDILVLLLTMIVVNHCGVNNTIYRTCHNPVPYGSFPVPGDGDLVVDFLSEDIDFDLLHAHTREYVISPHGTEPDDVTNTQTHPPISISHVVVITDKSRGIIPIFFDNQCQYRNWILAYYPSIIYDELNPFWQSPNCFGKLGQLLTLGSNGSQHYRPIPQFTCWRVYFGCNICGAYTSLPQLWKFALPNGDTIEGANTFYYINNPSGKCRQCHNVNFHNSRASPGVKLNPSSVSPYMAMANGTLSLPESLTRISISVKDSTPIEYKYRSLVSNPSTLPVYYAILPNSIRPSQVHWPLALVKDLVSR